jgi:hypothetical protein
MTDTNKTAPVRSMAPADEHDHDHDHSDVESLKAAALFHKALRMGRVEEQHGSTISLQSGHLSTLIFSGE